MEEPGGKKAGAPGRLHSTEACGMETGAAETVLLY